MIQKKSLKEAIQNPEIISVVGGLIGLASPTKDGLASRTLYKAAGSCFLLGNDRCLKIKKRTSANGAVLINITSFNAPSWATAVPRKVLLTIPYDSGTIQNVYAQNILNGKDMKIYKDDSFNLYIKCIDTYSTIFVIEIIQPIDIFSEISNPLLTEVPNLDSFNAITIH